MSKLIKAKINLDKIDHTKVFPGKQGKWLDINIWINDQADNYGNTVSVQQDTGRDGEKIYLGNGKEWIPRQDNNPVQPPISHSKAPEEIPPVTSVDDLDDLPFS